MAGTNSKVIKQKKQGEGILKTDVKEPVPCHQEILSEAHCLANLEHPQAQVYTM